MLKLRFISIPFVILLLGVFLIPLNAAGEENWYYCSVDFAGPTLSNTYIVLTDSAASPAFTGKWFVAPDGRAREILAVALAAMTKNLEVALRVDLNSGELPTIVALLLKK